MGTTALFAELVVGGVLTLTWMGLLAMTFLGPARIAPLLNGSTLTTGFLLAVAYALGVVFDRLWDSLLEVTGLQRWLRGKYVGRKVEEMSETDRMRCRVFGSDPKTAVEFVNYHRSRMRVARATFFNSVLITGAGLALLGVHYGGLGTAEFAMAAGAGGALCIASGLAMWKLARTHDQVLYIVSMEVAEKSRVQ